MTTQSKDPNEKVDHPRHYNQHPSGIETIEIIEHLPSNIANAVKYIWRCGLKQSETPLRDLQSALWYTKREDERITHFELDGLPYKKTDVVWRALAHKVCATPAVGLLESYLDALLTEDFERMVQLLEEAIEELSQNA
jgi:hypothetical protein